MTGKQILSWRLARGISQEKLAALLGVNTSTIWRWEKGRVPIPSYLAHALRGMFPDDELLKEVAA